MERRPVKVVSMNEVSGDSGKDASAVVRVAEQDIISNARTGNSNSRLFMVENGDYSADYTLVGVIYTSEFIELNLRQPYRRPIRRPARRWMRPRLRLPLPKRHPVHQPVRGLQLEIWEDRARRDS